MIRVMVADDHAFVRRGIKETLEDSPGITLVAEASNATEALKLVRTQSVDILVLDITLPDGSGLDVLEQISAINQDVRVLILSMHPEKQYALRALKAGAYGYVTKDSAPTDLVNAIKKIAQGERYITASMAQELANNVDQTIAKDPHSTLSKREYQVMILLAQGSSPTEIATNLSLSVKTVSTYRSRIISKLGVNGTAGIIRYAIEHNLVQ